MAIQLGSTNFGSLYLGSTKIGEAYLGSVKVFGSSQPDPYNPLDLPAYTMRFKLTQEYPAYFPDPTISATGWLEVSRDSENHSAVYDYKYENTDWGFSSGTTAGTAHNQIIAGLSGKSGCRVELIGANTSLVTRMGGLFAGSGSSTLLHSVCSFDTSHVTDMGRMFYFVSGDDFSSLPITSATTSVASMFQNCVNLTAIPSWLTTQDYSSVANFDSFVADCEAVQSGALALYTKFSSYSGKGHTDTFKYCGIGNADGFAELKQIPVSWGGEDWQNQWRIDLTTSASNATIGMTAYTVDGSNVSSVTDAYYSEDGVYWDSMPTTDRNNFASGGAVSYAGQGIRIYYTASDARNVRYSTAVSGVTTGTSCTARLYGKPTGSDTWTLVDTATTYQQNMYGVSNQKLRHTSTSY